MKSKKENEKAEEEIKNGKKEEIEINNIEDEIQGIVEECINCGLCKSLCPVFKIMKEEYYSPRGKSIMFSERFIDKIVFECNLCKACEQKCPLKIKVWEAVRNAREVLNLKGKELEGNKEMMNNIRQTGNPFGKSNKKTDKLYCC